MALIYNDSEAQAKHEELRRFAAMAMQGRLANSTLTNFHHWDDEAISKAAIIQAKELQKQLDGLQ